MPAFLEYLCSRIIVSYRIIARMIIIGINNNKNNYNLFVYLLLYKSGVNTEETEKIKIYKTQKLSKATITRDNETSDEKSQIMRWNRPRLSCALFDNLA